MKANISLFLSALSLFLVVTFISFGGTAPASEHTAELDGNALAEMRLVGTSTAACAGDEPASNLRELMELRFNPSMTRISFALHHSDHDDDVRFSTIEQEANRIVACVEKSKAHQPQVEEKKVAMYRRHLIGMQGSALAMSDAAAEGDGRGAEHWFLHLKQSCIGCHKDVRPPLGSAALLEKEEDR